MNCTQGLGNEELEVGKVYTEHLIKQTGLIKAQLHPHLGVPDFDVAVRLMGPPDSRFENIPLNPDFVPYVGPTTKVLKTIEDRVSLLSHETLDC